MKKMIMMLAAITIFAGLTATAQKSTNYLVGSISYSKSSGVDAIYSFNPLVGYYVSNKTSVGIFGEFGKSTGDETTTNVGAFARNDFMKFGKSCDVFAQLSVASKSTKIADSKSTAFESNLGLGANYSLNSKWGLTMDIADVVTYRSVSGLSSFSVGFGNIANPFATANFGLVYKF